MSNSWDDPRERQSRSGMVTAVGIINVILGLLNLACGMCLLGCGGFLTVISDEMTKDPRITSLQADQVKSGSGLFLLMGVAVVVLGVLLPIAGYGVLGRRRWGRTLSLMLGFLSGALAGLEIYNQAFLASFFSIAYCIFVIGVLTNKEYEAEFR